MTKFALRYNDGDEAPEQVAYVDGYAIEERLLAGVKFKVEVVTNAEGLKELVCTGVHPDYEQYLNRFHSEQHADWYDEAVKVLTEYDFDATDANGDSVHWGDA